MTEAVVKQILDHVAERRAAGKPVVVGFDVFDTVVTRLIPKEQSLAAMCRAVAHRFLGSAGRFEAVQAAYVAAYERSARRNEAAGKDYEATTDDLFDGWVKGIRVIGGDVERETLADCIVDVETRLLRPMPQAIELLEALRDRGVRAVFVSDMYLGGEIVWRLLTELGLNALFMAGYVSSDYARLKRTGNLFPLVLGAEGLSSEDLIFVGDDELADVTHPRALGATAFHFVFPEVEAERAALRRAFHEGREDRDALARAVLLAAGGPSFANLSIETFSANKYLGPYFFSFAFAVQREYADSEYCGQVLFAAREGHLICRLTDICDDWFPCATAPRKIYFPASRLTAFAFSLADAPFGMVDVANLIRNGRPTLRTLLGFMRLDEDALAEFATRVGIGDVDAPLSDDLANWSPIYRIIDAVNALPAFQKFRADGELFLRWIEQQGLMDGTKKLFVDLGWSAQIQDSIVRGFERRGLSFIVDGIYSGLRLEAHWRRRPGCDLLWYHCDEAVDDALSKAPLWFPQVLETLCRAPHGTAIGFDCDAEGAVVPVFRADRPEVEVADDALIARMHELVLEYAERLAHLCRLYEITPEILRTPVNERVFKFLTVPETEVARRFASFCNVSDLGSSEVFRYAGGMGEIGHDNDLFAGLEHTTLWPCGAAASFFGDEAAQAYAEEFIRRRARAGNLTRSAGLTEFNPNRRLNAGTQATAQSAALSHRGDKTAIAAWRARTDAITELTRRKAAEHVRTEARFRRAPGSMGLSRVDRATLSGMIDRAIQYPGASSWPIQNAATHWRETIVTDSLRADLRAASAMAEERYEIIQKMDAMIRERDQTIEAQGAMCRERWDAMQSMEAMIRERDRIIARAGASKLRRRFLGGIGRHLRFALNGRSAEKS